MPLSQSIRWKNPDNGDLISRKIIDFHLEFVFILSNVFHCFDFPLIYFYFLVLRDLIKAGVNLKFAPKLSFLFFLEFVALGI